MAMLYPTYMDLMNKANENIQSENGAEIKSRYSVVIAAAKRARQIVDSDGADSSEKPLSQAVEEMFEGKIRIVSTDR